MNKRNTRYSLEVRERAVRLIFEHQHEHESRWAAMEPVAGKIGCTAETLRHWVRQAERDLGKREGPSTAEKQRVKELEREVAALRRANEIIRKASAFFAQAELDTPTEVMVAFINAHLAQYEVEPICRELPIALCVYYEAKARQADPTLLLSQVGQSQMAGSCPKGVVPR
jgi:transposase-like protein